MDFFSQIDAYRTPGDAPSTTDTSRHAELVNPGGYFVRQPHPIPVFGGGTEIFPVDVSVIRGEARIPDPGMFRLLKVEGRCFLNAVAKTGGADHRTIGAGQTSCSHIVPSGMIVGFIQAVW